MRDETIEGKHFVGASDLGITPVNMSDIMIPLHVSGGFTIVKTTDRYLLT